MKEIALVGLPNCGKTTLFNALTGEHRTTGNFPGVTVELLSGDITVAEEKLTLTDLPGIYSFPGKTPEEKVTENYLRTQRPDAVLFIADTGALSRSLCLLADLSALGLPTFLACNMIDEVSRDGRQFDAEALARLLRLPVFPLSAARGEGVEKLRAAFSHLPPPIRLTKEKMPAVAAEVLSPPSPHPRADAADRFLLSPVFGIPAFFVILFSVFFLTYRFPGGICADLCTRFFAEPFSATVGQILEKVGCTPFLRRLVVEGVIGGVGNVLCFLPQIFLLFFLLTALEDCGYLSRAVTVFDPILSRAGLSGKAAFPLMLGFGCTVPALMATRTLDTEKERRSTRAAVPYIPCSARCAVFGILSAALFPAKAPAVLFFLYGLSLITAFLVGFFSRGKEKTPLCVELPRWRMPRFGNLCRVAARRSAGFLKKSVSVILVASVALFLARSFDFSFSPVADAAESMLGRTGEFLSPLFTPLGFGAWQAVGALAVGLTAKEAVAGALAVFYPLGIAGCLPPAAALSFLVFVALYPPCVAALSAYRKESGRRFSAFLLFLSQTAVAYLAAFITYRVALVFL